MIRAAQSAFFAFLQRFKGYADRGQPAAQVEAVGYGEPEMVEAEDSVELRVSSFIESAALCEMWGLPGTIAVSDAGFLRALDRAKATKKAVRLRINSGGGDVFAGVAIANAVRENSLPVTVDGVAASIASVIAAASPHVTMTLGSTIMVHRPWSCACGNEDAMRAEADILYKLESAMVDIYVSKTGAKFTRAQWHDALRGEAGADGTWWLGDEAVATGIADAYDTPDEGIAEEKARALIEQRQVVAEVHGVKLPQNLAELPGRGVLLKSTGTPTTGGTASKTAPSVRVSHRPGAFYVPRT